MRISDWSSDVCSSDLNINTAESNHDNIVQTHSYADRIETIDRAKDAGLSPCSGLIAGLGESDEQLVEALFALRELDADSIPVNFLMPFDGTPYENTRSEEHTSELQSLMRISYAVFCLKKKR